MPDIMTTVQESAMTPPAKPKKVYYPATAWYALAVEFFILDRVLKHYALKLGAAEQHGWFEFSLFKNTGIAFSLPVPPTAYWPLACIILAVLVYAYARNVRKNYVRAGMLFCVLLGAFSNLLDRATLGWTTDYLIFFKWSAINIADIMIVLGLIALGWHTETHRPRTSAPAAAAQE